MATVKRKNKGSTLRFLTLGVLSVIVVSAVFTTLSKMWLNIYEKYNEKKTLESTLVSLRESNESLEIDVEKLQDPEYVARYLKEKYFYSSNDEYIIRIPTGEQNEK
ncbi:MAG: septum formation initiator family protein [Bacilli bacterium]|nr:septum formation initiator family protein [Bacilli bacterium]